MARAVRMKRIDEGYKDKHLKYKAMLHDAYLHEHLSVNSSPRFACFNLPCVKMLHGC